MGYAVYNTPRGNAGYGVDDICHEDGCNKEIDRGLGYLCGNTPGEADEHGCGWWFCDQHLYVGPEGTSSYLCNSCILKYDEVDNDDED